MKHLYVMGTFRSGTTLLFTILNSHPEISLVWQPYWLFFKYSRNLFWEKDQLTIPESYPLGVSHPLEKNSNNPFFFQGIDFSLNDLNKMFHDMSQDLKQNDPMINTDMKPIELIPYFANIEPGKADSILTQLMDTINKVDKKKSTKITGTKEVFCEEFITALLKLTSPPDILHIIRDPRAVVASRNYGHYAKHTGSSYSIFFIINAWKKSVQAYFINKMNAHYTMIQYETLVTEPEKILTEICHKLKIKYNQEMLNSKNYLDNKGNPWHSNSSFNSHSGISSNSINQWQSILPEEEVAVIEYYCQDEMKALGYPVSLPEMSRTQAGQYTEKNDNIRAWMQEFDFRQPLDDELSREKR